MKKLLLLLVIASPFALNAMQKRVTIMGEPVRGRAIHPQSKRWLAAITVTVQDPADAQALEQFIQDHPTWKTHGDKIQVSKDGKTILVWSGLSKQELQTILDAFSKTAPARIAPAAPAPVKQALNPVPAAQPKAAAATMVSTEGLSQEAQDFLAKKNIHPPYTIYKVLELPETATQDEVKAAFDEQVYQSDRLMGRAEYLTAEEKDMLGEFREFILKKYDEYKKANP